MVAFVLLALGCSGSGCSGSGPVPALGPSEPTERSSAEWSTAQEASAEESTPVTTTRPEPPPALRPIAPRDWRRRLDTYLSRAHALEGNADADAHYELGRWAYEQGLEDEAWERFIASVGLDPDHVEARRAMGFVRQGAAWGRPGEVNEAWLEQVRERGFGLSFTVAIEDDAPPEYFEDLSWRFRRMSWFLWRITEGQVFLDRLRLEDQSSDGRFVIERGRLEQTLIEGGGAFCHAPGTDDWHVRAAGRVYVRILTHELLHGPFGLPDERHGCSCIMQGGLYGIRTDQLSICDEHTHRPNPVTPTPCWTLIQRRYPTFEHPNSVAFGRAPDVQIEVVNH